MTSAVVAVVAALAVAAIIGWLLTRRAGDVRATDPKASDDVDTSRPGPVPGRTDRRAFQRIVVRAVRSGAPRGRPGLRVDDLAEVAHVEIDMDANPDAARRLSVLSLPTTFIFDADGRQRYRTAGVPKADDLRSALAPLLA